MLPLLTWCQHFFKRIEECKTNERNCPTRRQSGNLQSLWIGNVAWWDKSTQTQFWMKTLLKDLYSFSLFYILLCKAHSTNHKILDIIWPGEDQNMDGLLICMTALPCGDVKCALCQSNCFDTIVDMIECYALCV